MDCFVFRFALCGFFRFRARVISRRSHTLPSTPALNLPPWHTHTHKGNICYCQLILLLLAKMEDQEEDHAPGSPDASLDDANASIQDEESIANTSAAKGVNRKSSAGSLDSKLAKVPQYVPEKVTLETKSVIGGEEYLSRSTLVIVPARQGSDYCVGDLVWARIQGFCFWPAIITIDPVSGMFVILDCSSIYNT